VDLTWNPWIGHREVLAHLRDWMKETVR